MGARLSKTQIACLARMVRGDGTIRREPGGFWVTTVDAFNGARWSDYDGTQTVTSLESKAMIERANVFAEAWRDTRRITDAGRAALAEGGVPMSPAPSLPASALLSLYVDTLRVYSADLARAATPRTITDLRTLAADVRACRDAAREVPALPDALVHVLAVQEARLSGLGTALTAGEVSGWVKAWESEEEGVRA